MSLKFRRHRRKPLLIFVVLMLCFGCLAFMGSFSEALFRLANTGCEAYTRTTVYQTIASLGNDVSYERLTRITRDQEGRATDISVDALAANQLCALIATRLSAALGNTNRAAFYLPLGNLTGLPLLSGRGIRIPLYVVPLGSVEANIISHLESAGINQVKHTVSVRITAVVSLMAPFQQRHVKTETTVLLGETVVVGDIPLVYAKGDS